MMRPFNHRGEVLEFVARKAPTAAAQRAVSAGSASLLGGFRIDGQDALLVRVDTTSRTFWFTITATSARGYTLGAIDEADIPWADWRGQPGGRRLVDGDTPEWVEGKRRAATHLD